MNRLSRLKPSSVYLLLNAAQSFIFALVFNAEMIYFVTEINADPLQLVLLGTALEISIFLMEVPTGVVADTYSRRLSVIIGVALIGVSFLITGAFALYAAAFIGQIVWGVGYTFTSGATEAWLADEIGESAAGPVYLQAAQLSAAVGVVGIILGMLLGSISLRLPILIGGMLMMSLAGILGVVMYEHGFRPRPRENQGMFAPLSEMRQTFSQGLKAVRARPLLITILLITLIFGAFSEGFDRLNQKHVIDNIGFPTFITLEPVVWFGLISLAGTLLGVLVTGWARRRINTESHQGVARALMISTGALSLAVIAFGLASGFWAAVVIILGIGALRIIRDPLTTAWVNQNVDSSVRATVLSMNGQADALGEMLIGPGMGALALAWGLRAALVIAGCLLAPALLLYWYNLHSPASMPEAPHDSSPQLGQEKGEPSA